MDQGRSDLRAEQQPPPVGRRIGWRGRLALLVLLPAVLASGPVAARGAPDGFADMAETLTPAVVNVSTTQKMPERGLDMPMPQLPPGSPFEEFFKDFFDKQKNGNRPARPVTSLGSGFIVDASGLVVTNNHVVADADEIKVILADQEEYTAKVVGSDAKTDVAVLRIEPKHPLTAVHFGDSDKVRVGDWVLAIGNPFGLGGTVTAGILSARGRDIRSGPYDDFLQTDAAINKGNSGGPLFNTQGEVIGINTAIFSQSGGSIGIGFAVPSKLAQPVVEQLIKFGHARRGWLGVRIQTVTDEVAEALGLDRARGALIAGVSKDGPADKAKIQPGDVVLSFDGKPVADMAKLPRMVAEEPIGKEVPVEVWRKGKQVKLDVTLGELKEEEAAVVAPGEKQKPAPAPAATKIEPFGFTASRITPALSQRFDLKPDVKGVVVVEIAADGIAAARDLQPGDVIVEFEQTPVDKPEQIIAQIKALKTTSRKVALLFVQRAGEQRIITLPLQREEK